MKKRILKIIQRTFLIILILALVLGFTTWLYMQKAVFGSLPSGESRIRIEKSSHYKNGEFQNRINTPTLAPGYSFFGVITKQLFDKAVPTEPSSRIPSVKRDLKHLPVNQNLLVWFGHSSTLLQIDGKKILIDPVFSDNASPLPNSVTVFAGTNTYHVQDLPEIDYLLISHDHYDHLDYPTVLALKDKVKTVICGLGVGAHFERWGYPKNKIIEEDWNDSITVEKGFTIHTLPARHKSGRGLTQNQSLWASYLISSPTLKVFYSGDGGYDTHFAEIGKKFGPIDVAIMENGQYNKAWHYIHMLPEETLMAARDLKAKSIVPVHNSKFALAKHTWNEPLNEISRLNQKYHIPLITPIMGEIVIFDEHKVFPEWWKNKPAK